jgi:NADPH2:quinone reductase
VKAAVLYRSGGPEVLQFDDVPDPTPGRDEVLIENHAAGINFSDTGRRSNAAANELPLILGTEAAGPILATGPNVTDFKVGDYVACQGISAGYAEKVLCRVRDATSTGGSRDQGGRLVLVPNGVKPEEAVGAMLQALTAHAMAFGAYQIKAGDRVLIQAGAGGVGLMLTQMAKNAGAFVYVTVGSDSKIRVAEEAGADEVINYSSQDFEKYVSESTGGHGVNAVFDAVGGPTFLKGMRCLAPLGTMISYGSAGGPIEPLTLNQLGSGKYVISTRMSNHTPTRAAWVSRASEILHQVSEGKLRTFVTTYPLSDAAAAHRALETRTSTGKLVLVPYR